MRIIWAFLRAYWAHKPGEKLTVYIFAKGEAIVAISHEPAYCGGNVHHYPPRIYFDTVNKHVSL